ncbi:unnamed protein product [Ectocarpus sp. CCAP 1310/34]|nr:unnamed protein product [Ectocarpus sp. CCAP 1310/34]
MSSGNVELLGDNVEILDYEPEGEAPTAEQFPAAGAGDESRPMPIVFTVNSLLANIATADPADLEEAYSPGRASLEDIAGAAQADAREHAKREDAERVAEREAALAAAARKQEEEREAALATAARKQEEERAAALAAARKQEEDRKAELAEREAYVQAAMAKQGALRSRLDHLEFRPRGPHAAALPSLSPNRRVVAPPQLQSQRASVAKENGREVAATPEVSVTLGRRAGEDGASTAAEAAGYEFHVGETAFLSRQLEMPAEDASSRPAHVSGGDKDYNRSAAPASTSWKNLWGDQDSTAKSGTDKHRRSTQSSRGRGTGDGGRGQAVGSQSTSSSPASRRRRSKSERRTSTAHQSFV